MGKYRDGKGKRFSVKNGKNVSRRKFTVTYFIGERVQKTKMRFFAGNTNTKGADDERNERISRRATESKMAVCVDFVFYAFSADCSSRYKKNGERGE